MPSRSQNDLNEILADAYNKACAEFLSLHPDWAQPFITCTWRSNDEQNALYEIGRTKPGQKVTNAKAGESPHNYKPSPAFDIGFVNNHKQLDWSEALFKEFADIITKIQPLVEWGGSWTGGFRDTPHYQLKDWKKYIH